MKRTVTITLRTLKDEPWPGAEVTFRLANSGFTTAEGGDVPKSSVTVTTDGAGGGRAELWCYADAAEETIYVCVLPSSEIFLFILPPGEGEISVETLRAKTAGVLAD